LRVFDEQQRINNLQRPPHLALVDDVLAGRFTIEEVEANLPEHNMIHNVHFEDHVVMQAQGAVADRDIEILASSDAGVRAIRDVWDEALAAFARDGTVRNAINPPPTVTAGAPATALGAKVAAGTR
jgi:hypothetical protein